jgi:hypothetical protein
MAKRYRFVAHDPDPNKRDEHGDVTHGMCGQRAGLEVLTDPRHLFGYKDGTNCEACLKLRKAE